eukprot:225998_1
MCEVIQILKFQRINATNERDKLLRTLDSKYTCYIESLLQQKLVIAAAITIKYDEMINKINDTIYNCLNNSIKLNMNRLRNNMNTVTDMTNKVTSSTEIQSEICENKRKQTNNKKAPERKQCNTIENESPCIQLNPPNLTNTIETNSIEPITFQSTRKYQTLEQQLFASGKNLKCEQCDKLFDDHQFFRKHMRITHNVMKPYKCCHCNQCFDIKNGLMTHIKQIHFMQFKNRYQSRKYEPVVTCKQCNKVMKSAKILKRHIQSVHNKVPKIECNICHEKFHWKKEYNKHFYSVHTEVRPYKCDICSFSYRRKKSLTDHKRTHTGERPYKCCKCNKGFIRSSNRNSHQKVCKKDYLVPYLLTSFDDNC